jgi:branched-chain amino acid transport system permease protein
MLDLLAQTGLNAVYAASYISLVAVGLVLIFGVMGVINFAHGELFMAGSYVVVAVYADMHMPFFSGSRGGTAIRWLSGPVDGEGAVQTLAG